MKFSMCIFLLLFGQGVLANQYVFPKDGQSAEQQAKDELDCDSWAAQQVGSDLAGLEKQRADKLAQAANQAPQPAEGAAAKGAVKGAIAGSLAGRDKLRNETAAAGAVIGAARAKKHSEGQAAQAQLQANTQIDEEYKAAKQEYFKARSVCLESKGYNVK